MSSLFFIIANQRTGTNYLRDRLSRDTNIHAMGEVFFPGDDTASNYDGHFFDYFRARIAADRRSVFLTDTNVFDDLFGGYFDGLKETAPRELVCVDIKSDCLRILPRLYEIIDARKEKIVHMTRRDKLARAISQIFLNMHYTKEHKYRLYGEAYLGTTELPYDVVRDNILAADGFDRFMERRYSDPAQRMTLYYEDLSRGPEIWKEVLSFVGATGEIRTDLISTQKKGLGEGQRVSNYDDLQSRLRDEGFID